MVQSQDFNSIDFDLDFIHLELFLWHRYSYFALLPINFIDFNLLPIVFTADLQLFVAIASD